MRRILVAIAAWLYFMSSAIALPAHANPVAQGRGGAVASVDERATQIGIDVLRAGGNAIDAAIATAAALGVVEPFSAGIGGGDFMVLYRASTDEVITLDGREQAPASASPEMFADPDNPGENLPFFPNRISSGLAVGVPGTVMTWQTALNRYGTLSLAEALAPAIALAESGFEVDETFVRQIELNRSRFEAFSSTRSLYLPNGEAPKVGTTFKNPDLARTYRTLAERGPNVFYRGEIAAAIARTVNNPPKVLDPPFPVLSGQMTLADLDRYHLRVRPAVCTEYRDRRICGMGLPSSGGLTSLEVLNILAEDDLSDMERAEALHLLLEAERLAFADRNAYIGDPEFIEVPARGLISLEFGRVRRSQIPERAFTSEEAQAAAGNPFDFQTDPSPSLPPALIAQTEDLEGRSTTHLTVSDREGNVVSYTLTIESTGGSGIVVPGYGFLLNNELTDFDATSPHPNAPEPGKRPRSSMAPTIVFGPNEQVMAFGSPGGSTIITTVLGIAVNTIDFGMSLDEALAAPRLSQRNGGSTRVDGDFASTPEGRALSAIGHVLEPTDEIGAATGIVLNSDGSILATAEPTRRGGGAARVVEPR
ncbi:MAG: gamma-glutamyltransferase [Cyanobacteria bacterium J06642_2]